MLYADSSRASGSIQLVHPFSPRTIKCAFHDVDGTHSLIREWEPVMTLVTGVVATYGMCEDVAFFQSHSPEEFPQARRFSIESAGLSALTQMEWALRQAAANGKCTIPFDAQSNQLALQEIQAGRELLQHIPEPPQFREYLAETTPKLFRIYEVLLRQMCRDKNLEAARRAPNEWRVPGSMEFLQYLRDNGVVNYFVTGAVVEYDQDGNSMGSMSEEIAALGYQVGAGKMVERLVGSTWNEKMPKDQIMARLCQQLNVDPKEVLIVGDGRSEIAAGVSFGSVTLSRLPQEATRAREIHTALGTNLMVQQYQLEELSQLFAPM